MKLLSSAGISSRDVPTGNLLWVDQVNGNDSLAVRGQKAVPFKTLTAAKTAAKPAVFEDGELTEAGDTIVVLPGVYYDQNLAKAGVNWHFLNGSRVEGVSTADWPGDGGYYESALFDVPANARMTISGDGEFESGACASVLAVPGDGAVVGFSARRMIGQTWVLHVLGDSEVSVRVEYMNVPGDLCACVHVADGMVKVEAEEIDNGDGGTALSLELAGKTYVRAHKIHRATYALWCYGEVEVEIEASEMSAALEPVMLIPLAGLDAVVTIRNARIASDTSPAIAIIYGYSNENVPPRLRLWNCFLKTNDMDWIVNSGPSMAFVGLYGKCTVNCDYDDSKIRLIGTYEEVNLD
jgi:hypothetical protein